MAARKTRQLSTSRIMNKDVSAVFRACPKPAREMLRKLRTLIIETASAFEEVGPLEETLKWGEPSFLTKESKTGSTIRMDWKPDDPDHVALFFKCTANLVPAFRRKFGDQLNFGGNRSILFRTGSGIPVRNIKLCIALALTYHLNKNLPVKKRWEFVESRLTF